MTETTDTSSILDVRGLKTWYPVRSGIMRRVTGHVRAVDGVDFSIGTGKTLALVGESGCGKSTVGRSILGLLDTIGGEIIYDGQDILKLLPQAFHPLRRQLQIIMQDPAAALDPRMTVRNAIAEGLEAFKLASPGPETTEKVAALMRLVSLNPDTMDRYPHEFSGGQRQRVCIARALAVDPRLIVCDEAISALDVSIQAQILNLLRRLQTERNLTYLFITHDLSVVRYFADHVAIMYLGRIVERGTTERIFSAPHHPYTKALLAAIPSLDPDHRGAAPAALGDVPSPSDPPSGCHYHPRCPHATRRCTIQQPPLRPLNDGASMCWLDTD